MEAFRFSRSKFAERNYKFCTIRYPLARLTVGSQEWNFQVYGFPN